MVADDEWTPCAVCGVRREVGAPSDARWLWVEAERLHAPGYWQAVFCSEDHAALWFGRPMPPADHVANAPSHGSSGQRVRAYLGGSALVVGTVALVTLAVVGAVSLLSP